MNTIIDHRIYEGKKVFCSAFYNYEEQTKCVCFMPYITDRRCTFKYAEKRCQCTALMNPKGPMVYIVGSLEPVGNRVLLEVNGVFDKYEMAVKACTMKKHFIGPILLNESLPKKGIAWLGIHYPLGREVALMNEKSVWV